MATSITVARRFCGPPDSANGGYVSGLLAGFVAGDAEVTLRRPPPLETPLEIDVDNGRAALRDGDTVVAEAVPTTVDIVVPAPVTFDEAVAVAPTSYIVVHPEEHPFPTCFVCGPDRLEHDGLRIFPAAVPGRDLVVAPWEPSPTLPRSADRDSAVATEIVWSALDCAGGLAMYLEPRLPPPYVLGRIAVHVDAPVEVGEPHVVVGWRAGVDGRKLHVGSAVYDRRQRPVAYGRATWVRLQPTT